MSKFIPNAFQVPNAFVDLIMRDLKDVELRCYLLLIRKTVGWNKDVDFISVSQFEEYTGKGKTAIIAAMKSLKDLGLVIELNETKNRTKGYALNIGKFDEWGSESEPLMVQKVNGSESELVQKVNRNSSESEPLMVQKVNGSESELVQKVNRNSSESEPLMVQKVNTQYTNTKNNTKNNITRLDGTTTQNPPLDDSQDTAQKTKSSKTKNAAEKNLLAEFGITGVLADDYIAHRKIKRASIAETVLTTLKTKAAQCGMTLEQAMTLQIANGWTGFEVEWVMNRVGLTAKPQNNINNVPKHDNGGYQEW